MKRHLFLVMAGMLFLNATAGMAQQRSPGGGIGGSDEVANQMRELERFINRAGGAVVVQAASGAWWNNPAFLTQLQLTEEQKARIERSFSTHQAALDAGRLELEKQETQLARLLEADAVDRNAALAQIRRVADARSAVEIANATMMLEMREYLTRAQWVQLQSQTKAIMRIFPSWSARPGIGGAK